MKLRFDSAHHKKCLNSLRNNEERHFLPYVKETAAFCFSR